VPLAAQPLELLVGQRPQLDVPELERVRVAGRELLRQVAVEVDRLDDAVGQHAGGDPLQVGPRHVAVDQVRPAGPDLADGRPMSRMAISVLAATGSITPGLRWTSIRLVPGGSAAVAGRPAVRPPTSRR
jgi:hypothetical protein